MKNVNIRALYAGFALLIGAYDISTQAATIVTAKPALKSSCAVGSGTITVVQGSITEQTNVDAVVNAANMGLIAGGGIYGYINQAAGPQLQRYIREHFKPVSTQAITQFKRTYNPQSDYDSSADGGWPMSNNYLTVNAPDQLYVLPGNAVVTPAFNMNCPGSTNESESLPLYIIHAVAPIYTFYSPVNAEKLMYNAIFNSIALAHKYNLTGIAIPPIGTGIYGYPFTLQDVTNETNSTLPKITDAQTASYVQIQAAIDYLQRNKQTSVKNIRFVAYEEDQVTGYQTALTALCLKKLS